jgi:hypothetical protein
MDLQRVPRTIGRQAVAVCLVAVVALLAGAWLRMPSAVAAARVVPAPAVDASASTASSEVQCWLAAASGAYRASFSTSRA